VAERSFGLADRLDELGETPQEAWQHAHDAGLTNAPPPLDLGPSAPELAPNVLGEDPPAPVPAADPDAALHHAVPGKFKPGAPAPAKKGKPELAPIADTGTIADTQEQLPDMAPVRPTAEPIEPAASFNELFHANSRIAQRDGSTFDDHMIAQGYAPILRALGLPNSENPAEYADLDAAGQARFGNAGQPSRLATAARQGEQVPFGKNFLADRALQESLIVAEIKKRRAKDPDFLKGVPDSVDGLHAYFLEQQRQAQAADEATVARSPGGLTGFAAALSGSAVGSFHDPVNVMGLAIPGGEGKSLIQIAARDALINGVLELGQQPIVAHNRAELGEGYTLGDAAANVASAAIGGAAFGSALHVGGKAAAATGIPQALAGAVSDTSSAIADRLFAALPEHLQKKWGAAIVKDWARRIDNGEKLEDVFSELSNRELTTLSRTIVGDQHLTPDERAAANVLNRAQEVGESSPYQPGPAGDATHENGLAAAIKDLQDRRTPEPTEFPSVSGGEGSGAASPAAATERPPAALSTTARRPQIQQAPEEAIASFQRKVYHAENATGDVNAKNPKSSASGPAQFTDPTFRDYYRKVYGQDPGPHPARELKNNPEVQARLLDRLTRDNAAALQRAGEGVNDGNLYLAHFLGSVDAIRVLKADASTPIERLVSADVLNSNPFLRGKSASEVAAWAHGKMGRQVASVSARGDAGALDPASGADDALIAQLNNDALQLDDQVIGAPASSASAAPPPMYARSFNVDDITVDANRFQFKAGGDELGVTDRLRGVKEWNPLYAGRVVVWEDKDGRAFLADGHQRHGLARRIQAETGEPVRMDAIVLREADGISAEDARVYAALKNIAEGTGTAVDAAKVIRDAGPHVLEHLPPKSALVRDGAALARLSDAAFGAVYNDVVPADFAAVIGHLLPDQPEAHEAMIGLLAKLDPANRGQAESIVRQGIAAGLHKEEQVDLFGSHSHVTSLMLERAKVLEKVLANLRKSKLVFNTAAKEADTLEAVGSKIAKSASEKEAQANAQALEIVARLAFSRGAVADALNEAAAKLAAGGKLADVADEAARAIRRADLAALAGEAANDDASRLAVDGAGRGGDTGEEGPQLPSQSGDPEQPGLTELERATERFSDPDGPAVKQQAESLTHDLKADVEARAARREKIKAASAELEKAKPGELRTIEPFPEDEPGYHRFRYVGEDGTAVGGNYTLEGNTIEGLNIGDVNDRAELGVAEVRKLFEQLHAEHPEVEYVHAYRKSGARAAEQEVWFQFTENGVKYHGATDPRPPASPASVPSTDVSPEQFSGVWKSKPFKDAVAGMTARGKEDMPHRESPVAEAMVRGWIDGQAGDLDQLVSEAQKALEGEGQFQPHGYNPRQGYIEAYYAAATGKPREIRAIGSDRVMGVREALAELAGAKPSAEPTGALPAAVTPADLDALAKVAIAKAKKAPHGTGGYLKDEQSARDWIEGFKAAWRGEPLPNDGSSAAGLGWHSGKWDRQYGAGYALDRDGTLDPKLALQPVKANDRAAIADNPLDNGAQTDPALAETNRQLTELGAAAPLRSSEEQLGTMGLGLFDNADQPSFRLDEEGGEISAADLLAELEDDDKAIKAMKDCL
jgi:hypothetical protein